jgi:guanylate kinase
MDRDTKKKGKIFVVSAPSGAGKTTLCQALLKKSSTISYSISHTTRAPRKGEKHGLDYFFISTNDFEKKIEQNFWAEWAKVHGNYYGTSKKYLLDQVVKGHNILLEIDIKGAKQIKKLYPDSVTIFIMPPCFAVLEKRLRERATDSEDIINIRLKNARAEMDQKNFYDHVIINDELDQSCKKFFEVVNRYL